MLLLLTQVNFDVFKRPSRFLSLRRALSDVPVVTNQEPGCPRSRVLFSNVSGFRSYQTLSLEESWVLMLSCPCKGVNAFMLSSKKLDAR